MKNDGLDNLSIEERETELKKRSHRRLFTTFAFINIALIIYLIYSIIMLIIH